MGKQVTAGQAILFDTWQMWESNPSQNTQLETWQTALSRTADPLAAGTYRVSWYWELRLVATGPVNSKAQARFRMDAAVKGIDSTIETDWQAVSGWDRVANVADGATPTFDIQFQRDPTLGGNDTVEIRRLKIGFERMGA